MRHKRLDQKVPQDAVDGLYSLLLLCAWLNPRPRLGPRLVQGQETALASPLDQLIRLRDEFGAGNEQPRVLGLCGIEHPLHVCVLGEIERGELGGRVVGGRLWQRRWLDERCSCEVVIEDGLAVGLENRLGGHDERVLCATGPGVSGSNSKEEDI